MDGIIGKMGCPDKPGNNGLRRMVAVPLSAGMIRRPTISREYDAR
jgi:hypothetical protein